VVLSCDSSREGGGVWSNGNIPTREREWEEMGLQLLLHYTMAGSNWRPSRHSMVQNFLEESQTRRSVSVYWELIYISVELAYAT